MEYEASILKSPEQELVDLINDRKKRSRKDILLPDAGYYYMLEKGAEKAKEEIAKLIEEKT